MLSFCVVAALLSTALAVKPIHSHNDYTRAVPLWDALNLSIMSVEADVWWVQSDNELYVAHTSGEINKSITLGGLYINPILGIINGTVSSVTPISVSNPLQLLIDFKSDGPSTYAPVLAALQPLRAAGHLTTYANGVLTQGAVTAVGTGNTPLASVVAASPRDLFFDADILQLYSTKPGTGLEWGPEIAPLASVDYSSVCTADCRDASPRAQRARLWHPLALLGHRRLRLHVGHLLVRGLGLGECGRLAGCERCVGCVPGERAEGRGCGGGSGGDDGGW